MRLRWWLKTGLQHASMIVLITAVYVALMGLQDPEFVLEDVYTLGNTYLWLVGGMFALMLNMNLYRQSLPLVLSFGSTRREAMVGITCYRLLPPVIACGVSMVLALIGGMDYVAANLAALPLYLGTLLAMGAYGCLMGAAYVKFGRKAIWIMMAGVVLLFMGVVVLLTVAALEFTEAGGLLENGFLGWIMLAVGIIAHGLSLIPEYRTVMKCNVKL